jgi:homoserine dehydrogenase
MSGGGPRRVRLCLLGFGNVARRLCEVLAAREDDLVERFGLEVVVTAAGTRSHGSLVAPAGLSPAEALRAAGLEPAGLQTAPVTPAGWGFAEPALPGAELIAASGADVLVESTVQEDGGAAAAIAHVEDALARAMHVLSVNKGPIAWDYRRLADLAAAHQRRLLFEGVTMDGCPVYNLAARCLPGTRVLGISGVLNSTTNYLLDAMAKGRPFDEALAWVQAEGFAEADPSHDIDGLDAASKTAALANVLMDARLTPADVPRESIRAVSAERAAAVRAAGRRLRVVCEATVVEGAERLPVLGAPAASAAAGDANGPAAEPPAVSAAVRLVEVDADHPFFAVGGSMSTVIIRTDLMGEVQVVERDALLTQTAYALYGDLLSLYAGL